MSSPHTQLQILVDRYPDRRKIAFVPAVQYGYALEDALAARAGSWAGLNCTTPLEYAKTLVERRLRASGGEVLTAVDGSLVALNAVDRLPAATKAPLLVEGRSQLSSGAARSLYQLFRTLRLEGVDPEMYRQAARDQPVSTARAAAYSAFVDQLDETGWADQARLFEAATDYVQARPAAFSDVVYAVFDEVEIPDWPARFLSALRSAGHTFVRIGTADPDGAPAGRAAQRFASVPVLSDEAPESRHPSPETSVALGAEEEVRSVFRRLLDKGVPLDAAELAYVHPEPYLALIDSLADELGVPITRSVGRAMQATRPGQALSNWFEWIGEGLDPAGLIDLLRGGRIRLDRVGSDANPHRVATRLASLRYDRSVAGYREAIARKVDALRREWERIAETGGSAERIRAEHDAWTQLQRALSPLWAAVPEGRVTLREMATRARQFIEQYGPVEAAEEDEEPTIDQVARTRLLDELRALEESESALRWSPSRWATFIREHLLTGYVRAERPKPGHLHVVPLESAGYAHRDRLYVVGLDAETVGRTETSRALAIASSERQAMGEVAGRALPSLRDDLQATNWLVLQALRRHEGDVTLLARRYDPREGEPCYPAPLFLRWASGDEPLQGPSALRGETATLSVREDWLAAYNDRSSEPEQESDRRFVEAHPNLACGLEAARERDSDQYTRFDGVLPDATYPELRLGADGRPVSASRIERLARTPYLYFLQYVLGVRALEEPALDDAAWLDARQRGQVLHDTFRRFMQEQPDPTGNDGEARMLRNVLHTRIDEEKGLMAPPNGFIEDATRRSLEADALVFLRAEQNREEGEPHAFEWGFGLPMHRRKEQDEEAAASLAIDEETSLLLRGRIDRIDRHGDGAHSIWDYKSGSSYRYEETDPLQGGQTIQWALYAYALEEITETTVQQAGYFFTSTKEMGRRIAFSPAPYRNEVQAILAHLIEMARTGSFPMNPDGYAWSHDFQRLDPRGQRSDELRAKPWPDDRPTPPHLQ